MADRTRVLLLILATLLATVPVAHAQTADDGTDPVVTIELAGGGQTAGPGTAVATADGTVTATVRCVPGCGPTRWYVDGVDTGDRTDRATFTLDGAGRHQIEARTAVGSRRRTVHVPLPHVGTPPTVAGQQALWVATADQSLAGCTDGDGQASLCASPPPAVSCTAGPDGAPAGCLTRADVGRLSPATRDRTDHHCADGSDPTVGAALAAGLLDGPDCAGPQPATVGQLWSALAPPVASGDCTLGRWAGHPDCGNVEAALADGSPTGQAGCSDPTCLDPAASTTRQAAAALYRWLSGDAPANVTVDGRTITIGPAGERTVTFRIDGDGCPARATTDAGRAVTIGCVDGPATPVRITAGRRTVTVVVPATDRQPTTELTPAAPASVHVPAGGSATLALDSRFRWSVDGGEVAIGTAGRARVVGARADRLLAVGDQAGADTVTLRACRPSGCVTVPVDLRVVGADRPATLVTDLAAVGGTAVGTVRTAVGPDVTVVDRGHPHTVCVRADPVGWDVLDDGCLLGGVVAGLIRDAASGR